MTHSTYTSLFYVATLPGLLGGHLLLCVVALLGVFDAACQAD